MTEPLLHSVDTEFDDRHVPLHLVLGAIAVLKRLRPLLLRQAAEAVPANSGLRAEPRGAAPRGSDDAAPAADLALYALLGIAGIAGNLSDHLRTASIPRSRINDASGENGGSRSVDLFDSEPWNGLLR